MDNLTPRERSAQMARVRSKNTKPELVVRRLVFRLGYRYRLHGKLPGHPDLVLAGRRRVIFVHGCFWHRHRGCPNCRLPKSRTGFWKKKFEANRKRDQRSQRKLIHLGWKVLVVWECETKDIEVLESRIKEFMEG